MDKVIVAVNGDLHVNSTVGLLCPRFTLDDGGAYTSSKAQRWAWNHWLSYWKDVEAEKRRLKVPVIAVLNGDLADDNNHRTTQIITHNQADIVHMTGETLRPCLDVADHIFITRGTEAHVGPNACLDELVAKDIGAVKEKNNHSWWWLPAKWGGVTFDIGHHPNTASRMEWTRGIEAIKITATLTMRYQANGIKPPQVALRAHNHRFAESGRNYYTRTFVTPPWQLTTSFGHRIGFGGTIEPVGGLVFTCEKGEYSVHVDRHAPSKRSYWAKVELANV